MPGWPLGLGGGGLEAPSLTDDADELASRIDLYLLGRLGEEDRERLEGLLFDDERVWEAVRVGEDRLTERYLAGELSADERADFETHFALTRSRRERIAFTRMIPRALSSTRPVETEAAGSGRRTEAPTPPSALSSAKRASVRAPLGLAVAAVLAMVVFTLGRAWSPPSAPALPGRLASAVPVAPPSQPAAASQAAVRGGSVSSGPSVATLVLAGHLLRGATRAGLPRLVLQGSEMEARIDVALDAPAGSAPYQAALQTVEGAQVWRGAAHPRDDRRTATVVVPASVLGPGDYLLRVDGAGTAAPGGAEYAFRVLRATPSAPH